MTHLRRDTALLTQSFVYLHTGKLLFFFMSFSGNKDTSISGVGFWVSQCLPYCILGSQVLSDCIISLNLNGSSYSTTDEDATETFSNGLGSYLQNIPNKELEIIMGDLNLKIVVVIADEHIRNKVG